MDLVAGLMPVALQFEKRLSGLVLGLYEEDPAVPGAQIRALIGPHGPFVTEPVAVKPASDGIRIRKRARSLLDREYRIEGFAGNDPPALPLAVMREHLRKFDHVAGSRKKPA